MAEVSSKLLGQFVDALEADIASSGRGTVATGVDEDAAPANGAGSANHPNPADTVNDGPAAGGDGSVQTEPSGPRRIDSPEAKPVDLVAVAGPSTVKRLLPVVGVVVLLLILWVRRRGHGTAGAV